MRRGSIANLTVWHAVLVASVLAVSISACQFKPTDPPTPQETIHSSPYTVMLAMLEATSAGDSQAFLELLALRNTLNLKQMDAIISMCNARSSQTIPFDVEYVHNDLAVGQLASLSGRYDFYMERIDGEWYISEIQGTATDCPF